MPPVAVPAGLTRVSALIGTDTFRTLLIAQPRLLGAQLNDWLDFFQALRFSSTQAAAIIVQAPEVLVASDVATAGAAILHLKALGFDNDEVRHRVVAFCPQVLGMQPADIDVLVRLWSKFRVGVDEHAGGS